MELVPEKGLELATLGSL